MLTLSVEFACLLRAHSLSTWHSRQCSEPVRTCGVSRNSIIVLFAISVIVVIRNVHAVVLVREQYAWLQKTTLCTAKYTSASSVIKQRIKTPVAVVPSSMIVVAHRRRG